MNKHEPPPERRTLLQRIFVPKSFLAEMVLLLAGAGSAQLIVVATAPLLSRLYTPANFAGLALLTSCVAIVSRVSSFKYETAIATGRNRPEMGTLAAIATWGVFGFTAAGIAIPLFFFPLLEIRLGTSAAIMFCCCLPVVILFDGLIQIVITWAVRWRQFTVVSANDLIRNGTSTAAQAGLGLLRVGGGGLMFGQAVGTTVAFLVLTRRGAISELYRLGTRSSWRRRRAVARRFADFPMFQMPKAVMNAGGRNLPAILIAGYYTAASTGFFFLAQRLTNLPAQLVSQSLGRVLMQRFANMRNVKRVSLLPLLLRSTALFVAISIPFVLAMTLEGPRLFGLFLGPDWVTAGRFATWTVLWSAGIICGTPAQMALTVQRKNRILLAIEAVFFLPRLLPFPVFAASGRIEAAIASCCVAGLLYNASTIIFAFYHSAREGRRIEASQRSAGLRL